MPDVVERTTCRLCQKPNMTSVLSLGELAVSNFVDAENSAVVKAPLELVLCNACGLAQLRHSVDPDLMYRQYWYRSVTNESMRTALADVTANVESLVELSPGDLVLDIGCNDGTLLRSYRRPGIRLCGFEPAKNLLVFARQGTETIVNDFFGGARFQETFGSVRAQAITTIAMFYDLEDPNSFVDGIARALDDKGVWVNQMASLPLMLEKNAFDNICHEHLEYYSLGTLEALYARHNLEVFDVSTNDVNGGSFRVLAQKKGGPHGDAFSRARVASMRHYEDLLALRTPAPFAEFAARVGEAKNALLALLEKETRAGKKVYGYGASTKGNTLLQYFGIDSRLVPAIAERNPEKWGRRTAGANIPIISEEQARKDKPDYFLILPWHFLPSFRAREQEYLAGGGRFIVPLPTTRVLA
jgi:SAM-dependent methyltransferase